MDLGLVGDSPPVTATSLAPPLNVTSIDGPRPAMLHALIDDKRLNESISDESSRRSLSWHEWHSGRWRRR